MKEYWIIERDKLTDWNFVWDFLVENNIFDVDRLKAKKFEFPHDAKAALEKLEGTFKDYDFTLHHVICA